LHPSPYADDAADRRNGYYRRHLLTELGASPRICRGNRPKPLPMAASRHGLPAQHRPRLCGIGATLKQLRPDAWSRWTTWGCRRARPTGIAWIARP